MKKLLATVLSATLVFGAVCTLSACNSEPKVKLIDVALSSEQYGIAVKKGNTELLSEINGVLAELKDGITVDGKTVTFQSIYEQEVTADEKGDKISIGAVKTASSNRDNEFVVATNAEFAPFEYMVGDTFGGIDMQVAKIIANKMNKELVVLHMDFDAVLPAVDAGNADIGIAGLTINDDRKLTADFSDPYYDTTQCIAVAVDDTRFDECETEEDVVAVLSSLQNAKAGAAKAQTGLFYLTGNEAFEFDGFDNITTTPYNSIALAVQDLANGKVELVCGDKDTLTAAVNAVNR